MTLRVLPQLLYGADHSDGLPWRGTGTETSVAGLRRQDLQDFHRRWIRPDIAIEAANDILGGSFSARINMNLREDKHWSYGARSVLLDARGQRPFLTCASVQADKTAESMAQIAAELRGILADQPATPDELRRVKDYTTLAPARPLGNQRRRGRFDCPDGSIRAARQLLEPVL